MSPTKRLPVQISKTKTKVIKTASYNNELNYKNYYDMTAGAGKHMKSLLILIWFLIVFFMLFSLILSRCEDVIFWGIGNKLLNKRQRIKIKGLTSQLPY